MKTSVIRFAICITVLILLTPCGVFTQTNNKPAPPPPNSEQILQDLLNEVRLLRAELLRTTGNIHRSQILLDRIRVQQEQVIRLTREVSDIHDKLIEVRGQQLKKKTALDLAVKQKDAGLRGEDYVNSMAAEVEELEKREQALVERESRFEAELESAKANLSDLNNRLEELEREMAQPASVNEGKPAKTQ